MIDLYEPGILQSVTVNGRHAWLYEMQTTIGNLFLVQHEKPIEMNIVDDYMGWSNQRAEQAFHRIATRMLRDKD
jgi:hypothetical protein